MLATLYNKHLARLGLTNLKCAELFHYSVRSSSRWNRIGPPFCVLVVIANAKNRSHLRRMIAKVKR